MNHDGRIGPRPQLILFDAVGTLIEPDPPVLTAYQQVGTELGDTSLAHELAERWRGAFAQANGFRLPGVETTSEVDELRFWRQVVAHVLAGVPAQNQTAAFERLWQHFAEARHWRLFDDVEETFTVLRRRGYRVGIASNFDGRLLKICQALPPLDRCRDIFVSSQVGWRKPAAGFYTAVQQTVQIAPQHILLIGDSRDGDCDAPQAGGWQARWLQRHSPPSPTGEWICSLRELLEIL